MTTPTMTIFRALPGGGKSHLTAPLEAAGATVASADRYPKLYTYHPDGSVSYDVSLADPSHGASYKTAIEAIREGCDVVVDNTNLSLAEIAPYVAIAQAYRATCEIVTINVNPEIAFARNTHGVPREVFFGTEERPGMVATFQAFEEPFHWQFLSWLTTREVSAE